MPIFQPIPQHPVGDARPQWRATAALRAVGAEAVIMAGTVHRPGIGLVMAGYEAVRNREEIRKVVRRWG